MCKYCDKLRELNEDNEIAKTDDIYLDCSGFFDFKCPINYCPNCGEKYINNNQ